MVLRAENITQMLEAVKHGDPGSAGKLMQAVYEDLKRVARRYLSAERADHTLQPTAIINEVFLRMFRPSDTNPDEWSPASLDWESRAHFQGIAARQMRQVLVDYARNKRAVKRSFGVRIELSDVDLRFAPEVKEHQFEAIDQLLNLLAVKDAEAAKVVELKFFGGLTDKEAALVMGINIAKLRRDWEFARSWLRQRMPNSKES